jgi:Vilmaviridae head maturation protease
MSKEKKDIEVVEVTTKKEFKSYVRGLELVKLELEVREAQIKNESLELDHSEGLALESHHGIFRLYDEVTPGSVERLRLHTGRFARTFPGEPVTVVISSPGGSLFDGWVLFDHLRALSDDGSKITTVVRGMAGSMAGILTQAGDKRVIGPESYVVIHEASSIAWGKASEMKEQSDLIEQLNKQALDVFVRRSKLTEKEINKRTYKKDWFIGAKECVKLGIMDKVG